MAPNIDGKPTSDVVTNAGVATPYRTPAPPFVTAEAHEVESAWGFDAELRPVLMILWIGSVIRVLGALCRHEIIGTEVTLAWMTVVFLAWRECGRWLRSLRRRLSRSDLPDA